MYIEEHNENMKRLEQAVESEREKQLTNIREKMKMRRMKQERMRLMEKQRKEKAQATMKSVIGKAKILSRFNSKKTDRGDTAKSTLRGDKGGVNYKVMVKE